MPLSTAAGSVIAAGIATAGSVTNSIVAGKSNKKTRKWQTAENEKSRQFSREMFDAANAYNDPSAAMARLKAAGINPHLAYSNGVGMAEQAARPVSASTQAISPAIPPTLDLGTILAAFKMAAEVENIEADTRSKDAHTKGQETLNGMSLLDLENKSTSIALDNLMKTSSINATDQQVTESVERVYNLIAERDHIKSKIDQIAIQNSWTEAETTKALAGVGLIHAQINNTIADTGKKYAETSNVRADTGKKYAETSNIETDTRYKSELIKGAQRGNYIGERFDLSNAEENYNFNHRQAIKALHDALGSEKENTLKELKMTEQEYINFIRMFEAVDAPVNSADNLLKTINPFRGKSKATAKKKK